jgi:hypothetical protein
LIFGKYVASNLALTEARRVGAKRRAGELAAVRDILYEDKWFRIATAVYACLKR